MKCTRYFPLRGLKNTREKRNRNNNNNNEPNEICVSSFFYLIYFSFRYFLVAVLSIQQFDFIVLFYLQCKHEAPKCKQKKRKQIKSREAMEQKLYWPPNSSLNRQKSIQRNCSKFQIWRISSVTFCCLCFSELLMRWPKNSSAFYSLGI